MVLAGGGRWRRGELTTRELSQHWRAERRERTRHTGKKKGKEQHENEN